MKGSFGEYATSFRGTPILTGLIASFVAAFVSIAVTAIVIGWSSIPESSLPSITYVLNMVSVLIGALLSARQAGNKGWYYGGLTGVLYAVLITMLGLLMVTESAFRMNDLVQILLMGGVGAFGGMIGVNLRK